MNRTINLWMRGWRKIDSESHGYKIGSFLSAPHERSSDENTRGLHSQTDWLTGTELGTAEEGAPSRLLHIGVGTLSTLKHSTLITFCPTASRQSKQALLFTPTQLQIFIQPIKLFFILYIIETKVLKSSSYIQFIFCHHYCLIL